MQFWLETHTHIIQFTKHGNYLGSLLLNAIGIASSLLHVQLYSEFSSLISESRLTKIKTGTTSNTTGTPTTYRYYLPSSCSQNPDEFDASREWRWLRQQKMWRSLDDVVQSSVPPFLHPQEIQMSHCYCVTPV